MRATRRGFIGGAVGAVAIATAAGADKEGKAMARPKVLFFDVNETLLDLKPLKESVGKALGGRPELVPLWFTTMLQYSLVTTVADRYHDFGEIGVACLRMVAKAHGIDLGGDAAKKAVSPPAHCRRTRTWPPPSNACGTPSTDWSR